MFIQLVVILAGTKAIILLFDKEWGHLRGVQGANLSTVKVFLEEVPSGFSFVRQEGVNLSNFGSEGVIKVDFVVIGS